MADSLADIQPAAQLGAEFLVADDPVAPSRERHTALGIVREAARRRSLGRRCRPARTGAPSSGDLGRRDPSS
jgi:hypothetical protein